VDTAVVGINEVRSSQQMTPSSLRCWKDSCVNLGNLLQFSCFSFLICKMELKIVLATIATKYHELDQHMALHER
jgi:hypothetical protein